jgi:molybdopterin molybdotransferase
MLTVAEAIAAILAEARSLAPVPVPLDEALGLVLAEDAFADLDSPPFDKALMDGYAVRSADVHEGRAKLHVIEEVLAGQVSHLRISAGEAIRIMTGAPIPAGADAVVPIEHTRLIQNVNRAEVAIETSPVQPGRNRLLRGASIRLGECVLPAGRKLRPQELGCLAELGKSHIKAAPRPSVAVLATGDELVSVGQTPGPGQIRNSNETMLVAQLQEMGAIPNPLGIARDDPTELKEKISLGLQHDVVLLSGGVSAGKVDFVPAALAELGVRQVFHKVRMKPGQPIWFGVFDRNLSHNLCGNVAAHHSPLTTRSPSPPPPRSYVFGLPGNPVSSMVCCELFARTAIRRLMGIQPAEPAPLQARLACEHKNHGNRPTYHPARLEWTVSEAVVAPVPWIGSADLSATTRANAMALFPEGDRTYPEGTIVNVFPW